MKRGQDGPAVEPFPRYCLRVHRDIERAVEGAEHEQCGAQRCGACREGRSEQCARHQGTRNGHETVTAEPVGQRTGRLHAEDRAGGEEEKQRPKRRVGDVGASLDRGNVHDPDGEKETVDPENAEECAPGAAQTESRLRRRMNHGT